MASAIFVLTKFKSMEMLVERRKDTDSFFPGQWLFPGGKLDEGEDPENGMIRECHEELGVLPTDYSPILSPEPIYSRPEKLSHRIHPFVVFNWTGDLPNRILDSGNPLAWKSITELEESPAAWVRLVCRAMEEMFW